MREKQAQLLYNAQDCHYKAHFPVTLHWAVDTLSSFNAMPAVQFANNVDKLPAQQANG